MGKRKSSQASEPVLAGPAMAEGHKGFQPGPTLREVEPPRGLDIASGSGRELWLMQLPLDFEVGESVRWEVSSDVRDGFRAKCKVGGVEYVLCPDADAATMPVYVPPAGQRGVAPKVARRVTVLRTTEAPQLCFGQANGIDATATPAKQPRAAAAGEAAAEAERGGSAKRQKQAAGGGEKELKKEKTEKKEKKDKEKKGKKEK